MKRVKFFLSILCIVVISISTTNAQYDLEIGKYHNIILDSLFGKTDSINLKNDYLHNPNQLFIKIINIGNLLNPNVFSKTHNDYLINKYNEIMVSTNIKFYDFTKIDLKKMIDYMKDNSLVKSDLSDLFYSLYYAVETNKDTSYINNIINSMKMNSFSSNDNLVRDIAIDIYSHSKDFWKDKDTPVEAFGWVTLGDMFGGALGTAAAGPFGGFALGAFASAELNLILNDRLIDD